MMLIALALAAFGAETPLVTPELTFGGGLGGGGGLEPGSGSGSAGIGGCWFPVGRVGFNLGVREGLWASPTRTVGEIDVGVRWRASASIDLLGGFVHHHETPWPDFLDDPTRSFLGVSPAITHRSGANFGVSWGKPVHTADKLNVVFRVDGVVSALTGAGPVAYGQVDAGLWFEIPAIKRKE